MTTKHKGMVITIFLVFMLSLPLFAQKQTIPPLPENYTVAEGYLLISEKDVEEVVNEEVALKIDNAVKEAVAIAVKEEQKKNIDLQMRYDGAVDTVVSQANKIKDIERTKLRDILIWSGGSFAVGTVLGIVLSLLSQIGN